MSILNQGEDVEDWADYSKPADLEVRDFQSTGFALFLQQQVHQETNNSETQEAAKQAEHLDMTSLPSDSKKVKRLRKEAI